MHIFNRSFGQFAPKPISRRDFLRVSGGLGIGLVVGFDAFAQGSGVATVDATGFVRIAPDNTVTVMIKHLEMGQGPYTGLATLVAEELDADWAQMRAEGAPANNDLYKNLAFGIQGTGGSTAVANSYEQMRKAGATARAMLVAAAAESWKVPASQITVKQGVLRASGHQATFGEFAEAAARQTPPKDVKLKNPKDFTLIGHKLPRLDASAEPSGRAHFPIHGRQHDAPTRLVQ